MDLRTKATVADGLKINEHRDAIRLVEYQPGNGTRYVLVISEITEEFSGKARDAFGFGTGTGYIVSWSSLPYRTLTYSVGAYLDPMWLRDKVKCSLADAVVLCELLAHLTDCTAMSCDEHRRTYYG